MFLYTDCYTPAGYTPMRMEAPEGRLEPFGRSRMEQVFSAQTLALMTGSAMKFFAGEADGRRFLRICQIPTRYRDENRRRCYINLAFEGTAQEPVDALAAFALSEYPRFAQMANRMIVYSGQGYEVNAAVLREMIGAAKVCGAQLPAGKMVIVPGEGVTETMINDQLKGMVQYGQAEIRTLEEPDEASLPAPARKDEKAMKLYFYFSSPADGFGFVCVSPQTGETLAAGNEASEMLNQTVYNMVTNSGMSLALFRGAVGKMSLVVKKINTEGKNQKMSLVIEDGEERMTRAVAACALYRNKEFCDKVAACTGMDEAGKGVVDAEAAKALIDWAAAAQAPAGVQNDYDKVKTPGTYHGKPYVALVVDPSLEYLNNMIGVSLKPQMIGMMMDENAFAVLRGRKATEAAPQPVAQPVVKQPVTQEQPAPVVIVRDPDEESINLLDYKWFLPAVIGVGAALVLIIALAIGSALSKPEEPADTPQAQTVEAAAPAEETAETTEEKQEE